MGSTVDYAAISGGTLTREQLAAAAAAFLQAEEPNSLAYLTRTFAAKGPEHLGDAQLK